MTEINLTQCRLCGSKLDSSNKRRSHALTKASFFDQVPLKSGEHLLLMNIGKPGVYDAGHHAWEYALCGECEEKIGKWEDERERFLSSAERPTKSFKEQKFIETMGFNQESIALACLADLYRCSVFVDELYGVDLGEKHSKKITDILNRGKLNNFTEYPVVMKRYNNQDEITDGVFQIPSRVKFKNGIIAYEVIAPRGWSWIIKVDSRSYELMEKVALGSCENIRIINGGSIYDWQNRRNLSNLMEAVRLNIN